MVDGLIVWVPGGIETDEIAAIINVRKASGQRGGRGDGEGYEVRGFPEVALLLQGVGSMEQVASNLCRPARVWRSLTPYLPVRRRQRASLTDHLAADIRKELEYRGLPQEVTVASLNPEETSTDRWSLEFRRHRVNEPKRRARAGRGLRLSFADETVGPLLLGQLSHFGYGMFVPDAEKG
jgi:CRISPR-associated protein Csb2